MLAHMKVREGNIHVGTPIQSLRMSGPLDGASGVPATGHPLCRFLPCYVALGGANSTNGFLPLNLKL
jgi:hypothetical protein